MIEKIFTLVFLTLVSLAVLEFNGKIDLIKREDIQTGATAGGALTLLTHQAIKGEQ